MNESEQKIPTDKWDEPNYVKKSKCPKCNEDMVNSKVNPLTNKVWSFGLFGGGMNVGFSGSDNIEAMICSECGYLEFYSVDSDLLYKIRKELGKVP